MPPPPSSVSALSLLPALSVVLGLPLCHTSHTHQHHAGDGVYDGSYTTGTNGHDGNDGNGGNVNNKRSEDVKERDIDKKVSQFGERKMKIAQPKVTKNIRHDRYEERVKNNVARIYARRMMDRAKLEREHPWGHAGEGSHITQDEGKADMENQLNQLQNNHFRKKLKSSYSQNSQQQGSMKRDAKVNDKVQMGHDWKDQLLSETLLSLIAMKQRMEDIKSFSNSIAKSKLMDLPDLPNMTMLNLADLQYTHPLLQSSKSSLHPIHGPIACCESPSDIKERTKMEYENLKREMRQNESSSSSIFDFFGGKKEEPPKGTLASPSDAGQLKPAEWDHEIDLAQRRLDFGKEISPLSNTTRLERWWMASKRMATLGILAAPLGFMIPCNLLLGNLVGSNGNGSTDSKEAKGKKNGDNNQDSGATFLQRKHQSLTDSTWNYALWAIEQAGPTYIKLVQWASTRNDLFSPEFVGHFAKLQDETRGHRWRETEVALHRAFGKDWRRVLSFEKVIEDEEEDFVNGGPHKSANRERQKRLGKNETGDSPTIPIGSGCVAQVYKARLRTSHGLHPAGTSVAVKVQHPHILEKVCLDFYIMNKFASFLEYIPYLNLDYLSMKDSVDQFRDIMLPQLDLRVEAHNLKRFRRDFEGETQIAFPEPLMELTSREVLVERFVEGEPMLNFVKREDEYHKREDREELATIGLKTVMKMIFLHDFIHADLHPGNMIVDRNKTARGQPLRIHMIDCGLTVELGERDHVNMVKILGSLIKRDGYAAGQLMVDTAKKCQATDLDVEMFCRGIEKICVDDEDNNFLESVGDYITDICYLACKHKVKLEAAFINAALACEIMEGLAASLYPEMRVQSVALPMVLKAEMMHGLKGLPAARIWMQS